MDVKSFFLLKQSESFVFIVGSFVKQKESIREEHFRISELKRCYIHYFKYLGY